MEIKELVGEVLTHVDVCGDDVIMLTTAAGRQIRIYHDQDCCESVSIESTDGDWVNLYGKVLTEVSEETEDASNEGHDDSATRTTLKFVVDGATVINRWLGSSNGYYSESISFAEVGG